MNWLIFFGSVWLMLKEKNGANAFVELENRVFGLSLEQYFDCQ